jgi:MFS family permease
MAATFTALLITRIFVGIGEGGYGPAAPTVLADLFPIETRGRVLAIFCAAIPVGSALGYALGGGIGNWLGWRWAFYLVAPPGLILGLLCFLQRDPRTAGGVRFERHKAALADYLQLARTRSYVLNCGAQTAMTFAVGGIGFWAAAYLKFRGQPASATTFFGGVVALAGLLSTVIGGWAGDKLRNKYPGSYFLVSGVGIILAVPVFVLMLFTPFPFAWVLMFVSIFFMFLNTGPSNTAIANVSLPKIRATAFALNILVIHAFGDVLAFPTIGLVAGHTNWTIAFLFVAGIMLVSGVLWLAGTKYLAAETAIVEKAAA